MSASCLVDELGTTTGSGSDYVAETIVPQLSDLEYLADGEGAESENEADVLGALPSERPLSEEHSVRLVRVRAVFCRARLDAAAAGRSSLESPRGFPGVGAVRDSFGKAIYLAECEQLAVTPVAQVVKYLEHEELRLAHYGIGARGVSALVAALTVRSPTSPPCRKTHPAQRVHQCPTLCAFKHCRHVSSTRTGRSTHATAQPKVRARACAPLAGEQLRARARSR